MLYLHRGLQQPLFSYSGRRVDKLNPKLLTRLPAQNSACISTLKADCICRQRWLVGCLSYYLLWSEILHSTAVLACNAAQAALACGLLGVLPFKPRFVGFLGIVASAINCYMLFPALPKAVVAPAKAVLATCPAPETPKLTTKVA